MTHESRRSKARLTWLWLAALYRDHPNIVAGRILSVVSPEVESYAPSGVPCGAESGHAYRTMPKPIQSMYTAPYAVFSVKDYEARYYTLLRLAAASLHSLHLAPRPCATSTSGHSIKRIVPATSGARGRLI